MEHDARAIANAILSYAKETGRTLTLMQLIKLVYLVYGWGLSLLQRRVVNSSPQAWQYGPVFPHVYKAFKQYGSAPITELARDRQSGVEYRATLSEDEGELLRAVVDAYGDMHAFQLSNIMHKPGTPWTHTYESNGPYSAISDDLIRQHFDELRRQREPA
jgi:uncharacterized phage-associated protein